MSRPPVFTVLLLLACAGAVPAPAKAEEATAACSERGNYVVVDTSRRRLALCSERQVVEEFPVSLGRGGVGNHAHGANRTPTGVFELVAPRPSKRFGTFISFLGAWGLHGPSRGFRWAGRLTTLTDWTQGCVATGSDAEIERIAAWIRKHSVRRIVIGPDGKPPRAKGSARSRA